jgi:hypothetical protein
MSFGKTLPGKKWDGLALVELGTEIIKADGGA